ncbi:MAG: polysaccharide deacetylase family protein [Chloroflexi bacterium]|nr:polysaccharide deacetylase family protein [Chloroflexota bacterium]
MLCLGMVRSVIFVVLMVATDCSLLLLYPLSLSRFILAASIFGPGICLVLYLLFHPRSQWLVRNRSRVADHGRPCVALTFDDGPNPASTPKLLDILRAKGVVATFFVIGEHAERYPGIVQRAQAEGHLIGTHTWSHPSLFCFLTPSQLRSQIDRGCDAIQRICGFRPRHFRSPVGLRHALLGPYLRDAGLEYVSWRVRTRDTFGAPADVLVQRIVDNVVTGDIVLLHDHTRGGAAAMLQAVPEVIDRLRSRGFEFVLAGDLPVADAVATRCVP